MKKLNCLLASLLSVASLPAMTAIPVGEFNGQQIVAVDIAPVALKSSPMKAAEEFVNYGYCDDNIQVAIGFDQKEELKAAFIISRDMLGAYRNAKVMGVRVGTTNTCSDITAFIIEGSDFDANPKMTSSLTGNFESGWKQLMFRVPYQFENDLLIVGYSATGTNFIGYDGATAYQNSSYIWRNGSWGTIYNQALRNDWGSACIQLLLGGDELPENEMAVGNILTRHAEQNKQVILQGEAINNTTKAAVSNYEVTCIVEGGETVVERFDHAVGPNRCDTFSIALPPIAEIGTKRVQVSISRVNGMEDAEPGNNTTIAAIDVVEEGCYFPRTVVIEEATSLECGYCPSGIVIMESMTRRLSDLIAIAVHTNDMGTDELTYEPYEYIQSYFSDTGLPNGIVNRKSNLSGMPAYFEKYYEQEAGQLAVAKVVVEASKVNAGKIAVKTDVTFNSSLNGNRYLLAYVLVEDGVIGHKQLNYYSGGGIGQMGGWENLPREASVELNHIARGIWNLNGIVGSIPADVVKKQAVEHTYTIDVPQNVQSYENLSVVALLLDTANNGEIVQAAKTNLGENSMTGIASIAVSDIATAFTVENGRIVADNGADVEVYTLDGRRLANNNLATGLYIARCGNQSAKIAVR